jgi:hypothetical protein
MKGTLLLPCALLTLAACAHGGGVATTTPAALPPICGAECTLVARHDAGRDAGGEALVILEVSRGAVDVETGLPPTTEDASACELKEWWLERAGERTLALALCNDGYGASGVGEDTVTISPNRLVHQQYGGSAWRWSVTQTFQLAPRRLLTEDDTGYWNISVNTEERHFDFAAFEGSVTWFAPSCDASQASLEAMGVASIPEGLGREYRVLPVVSVDASFDPSRMGASGCSTRIDGTGERGFLLSGAAGTPTDAFLEIIAATDRTVTILVHDDAIVPSGAYRGDTLRVIFGETSPSYFEHCIEGDVTHSSAVFDVATGRTLEGTSGPLLPVAGATRDGRYLRITFPYEEYRGGLTVTYSDVDDAGPRAERVFGTSAFEEASSYSLGALDARFASTTHCAVQGEALVRQRGEPQATMPFAR